MPRRAKFLFFYILIFFPGMLLTGQKMHFRNYTIKEGLPQNTVLYMVQDQKGYLWMATQVGAARFDGKSFTNFSVAQGLPDNIVNFLLEDSRGRIWVATNAGVSCILNDKLISYTQSDGLPDQVVNMLAEDNEGHIWCITQSGIAIISGDSIIRTITEKDHLPSNSILKVFKDSKARIWLGTYDGVVFFDKGLARSITKPLTYLYEGKPERIITDINEDASGRIWIATQGGGIFVLKDSLVEKHYTVSDGLGSNTVLALFRSRNGQLWCGHYKAGISSFNGRTFNVHASNLVQNDAVREITEDLNGELWVSTYQSGLLRGTNGNFKRITTANGLIDDQIQDLFLDVYGNVWVGTLGGVSMFGKGIFELYTTDEKLRDNNVLSVECLADGAVMAGSYNNLAMLSNGLVTNFNENVLSLFQDRRKTLWMGYWGKFASFDKRFKLPKGDKLIENDNGILGISDASGDSIWLATERGAYVFSTSAHKYRQEHIFDSILVKKIYQTQSGSTWFSTVNGVFVKNKGSFIHFDKEKGMPSLACTGIASDEKGKYWVGTDNGLVQFVESDDSIKIVKVFNKELGLVSNTVYSVIFDGHGSVWIGTEKGLNRILISSGEIRYYGMLDGFTPLENNVNAVSLSPSGKIWFGTVAGLVSYDPSRDSLSAAPPRTYITHLRFSEPLDLSRYSDSIDTQSNLPVGLRLPYTNNTFSFECIGIHLTIPEKVRYKYFLEGYDDDWSAPTPESSYECKKLPEGHYTLYVLAANNDGFWSDPVSFSFQVRPPIYRTIWAYIIYVLLIILVLYSYVRYRERKLQHDKKVLEDEVKKRTAEIAKQKEEIEHINDELREQQQEILAQRDEIERQRDIATQQRDQIGFQKKEITDSIHYAKRIQNAILPSEELARQILPEHFILFKPRDIVSGDFYWMARKGEKLVITAADCTGHGVPGAFMSMLGVSLLNEIVNKEDVFVASEILNNLRHNVKLTLSQTGKDNEAKDGMDIALCVVDFENRSLQYAGANNPFYLVRNGELIEYKADGMPIGIYVGEEKVFTNNEISLQSGDACYLFSDGYADQFGGPTGGKFKTKPFKRLIAQESALPMDTQKASFDKALEDWKGILDQVDDILVIGFRIP